MKSIAATRLYKFISESEYLVYFVHGVRDMTVDWLTVNVAYYTMEEYEMRLRQCKVNLLKYLRIDGEFIANFVQRRILTDQEVDLIMVCRTDTARNNEFLRIIRTRGELAYDLFVNVLRQTSQHDLANQLGSRNVSQAWGCPSQTIRDSRDGHQLVMRKRTQTKAIRCKHLVKFTKKNITQTTLADPGSEEKGGGITGLFKEFGIR